MLFGKVIRSPLPHARITRLDASRAEALPGVITVLTGADSAEQILGVSISSNLLPLLGVRPVLGRSFSTEEAEQGQRLVMISHRFWQARFGGAADALGATLVLNGAPSQIVGILPAGFQIARLEADVWEPHATRRSVRGGQTWFVIGRLRPGVTFDQAQAEMSAVARPGSALMRKNLMRWASASAECSTTDEHR